MSTILTKLLRGVIGAAVFLAASPGLAQLAPLSTGQGGQWPGGDAQPAAPPPNPNPRNFTGSWKVVPSIGPDGSYIGSAFVPADMVARARCLPNFALFSDIEGTPEIVQTPKLLVILFEEEHRVRLIRLNGTHPAKLAPSYWGDSIGHWEGNTLVVETTGVKGRLEAGGPLVSPKMTVTERFRKIEGGTVLIDQISYADPAGEKLPPPITVRMNWAKPQKIMEWICEDGGQVFWNNYKK